MSQQIVVTIPEPIAVNRKVFPDQDPVRFQVPLSTIDCPTKLVILDISLKFTVTQVFFFNYLCGVFSRENTFALFFQMCFHKFLLVFYKVETSSKIHEILKKRKICSK